MDVEEGRTIESAGHHHRMFSPSVFSPSIPRIHINILAKGDTRAPNAYLDIYLFSFLSLIISYLLSERFGDKLHPFASRARVNHAKSGATIEKNAEGVSSSDAGDLLMDLEDWPVNNRGRGVRVREMLVKKLITSQRHSELGRRANDSKNQL